MTIVPVYAALLALVYIYLSTRVIRLRRSRKIALGANGDPVMERAMRVHANFAEYTPFALLLLFMLEANGGNDIWLNILCVMLLAGRVLHALGLSKTNEDFRYRVTGMVMTFTVIGAAALSILGLALLARV